MPNVLHLGDDVQTRWPVPVKTLDRSYEMRVLAGEVVALDPDGVAIAVEGFFYPPQFPYGHLELSHA